MLLRQLHYAIMNLLLALNAWALATGGAAPLGGLRRSLPALDGGGRGGGRRHRPLGRRRAALPRCHAALTLPMMALNAVLLVLLFGAATDSASCRSSRPPASTSLRRVRPAGRCIWRARWRERASSSARRHQRRVSSCAPPAQRLEHDRGALAPRLLVRYDLLDRARARPPRQVCTPADPATARRGEHPLAFALRSTVQGNLSAARIEAERLRRKQLRSGRSTTACSPASDVAGAARRRFRARRRMGRLRLRGPRACRASSTWSSSTSSSTTASCASRAAASSRAHAWKHLPARVLGDALQPAAALASPHVRDEAVLVA